MLIRIFHHTFRLTRWMVLASLLALATTLSLVRLWLLPEIDQFRHQLEAVLTDRLQQPVHIRKLRASLYQFTPQLRLLGITIGDPAQDHLSLREIQVVVDLLTSIRQHHLAIESIRLVGANIHIERTSEGQFKIRGLGDDSQGFPPWLLGDGHFELVESTLRWHLSVQPDSNPPPTWRNVRIQLVNRGNQHQLAISFYASRHWVQQAQLHIHFHGNPRHPEEGRGRFLLTMAEIQLASFQELLSPLQPGGQWWISKGRGRLNMVGKWRQQQLEAHMELALDDVQLRHAGLHYAASVKRLDARIDGKLMNKGWRLSSPYLRLQGKGFDITSRLSLDQPVDEAPDLELFALVSQLDLAHLTSQLPTPANPRLARWLGIKPFRGTLSGRLLWRGKLTEYPFKDHNGIAEADLSGRDLVIRFLPDWPAIEQADIHLQLSNDEVRLGLTQARFANALVGPASGKLKLESGDPFLHLELSSHAKLTQVFNALKQSPLRHSVDRLTAYTDIEGRGDLHLRIDIPLRHARHTQIDGQADISGAKIALKAAPLVLTNLNGKLAFDRRRITTSLKGRFKQHPAQITAEADSTLGRVRLRTRIHSDDLPASIPMAQYLQGESDITVALVRQQSRPIKLTLHSDLSGTTVLLPAPLGKSPASKQPLNLTAWLTETGTIPLTLDYQPLHATFSLNRKGEGIDGRIGINQPPPPPAQLVKHGLIVAGRLEHLDLSPWFNTLKEPDTAKLRDLPLKMVDLEIGDLSIGEQSLGGYRLKARLQDDRSEGDISTPYGSGKWWYASESKRLNLTFDSLAFDDLAGLHKSTHPTEQSFSLAQWPAIHMNVIRLNYQDQDLGHLEVRAMPQHQTLRLDLKLAAPTHRLEASGTWHTHPSVRTRLQGHFTSPDLADFLKRINHPTALVDTPARIDFDLNWPAPPYRFALQQLNGYLKLELGPGRWLDVEPGAGRLFGLLYLGTLQRRLRLDFSDLFASGLSYDHIGGYIRLAGGRAFTDDLMIEAVPARIFINGSVDLAARRTDELITVIPNTPLTLGLVGENHQSKLGKAAGYLQRMINTPLDSVTQSQYAITGTWDDPVILRLRRSVPGTILHGIWSGFKKITGNQDSK